MNGRLLEWALHPFIHASISHLYGNLAGFGIVGVLLESWAPIKTRRFCYTIFLVTYLISLGLSGMAFTLYGVPAIGSSGMIFGILAFDFYYYFFQTPRLTGIALVVPVCMGFVIGTLIVALMEDAFLSRSLAFDESSVFHLLNLTFGLLAVDITSLLRRQSRTLKKRTQPRSNLSSKPLLPRLR
jgi:membrane associated rhomboid family serine protease